MERIALARQLNISLDAREPESFTAVVFAEIDSLGDIAVGLSPVLADFKHQPGTELELALPQQVADAKHQAGAFLNRSPAPMRKGAQRRLHGWLDMLLASFLM